jgi:hypothetical protein
LQSSNANVRSAAINVLGTCHRHLGPSLAAIVKVDLKPAQISILEEAFLANPQQTVAASRKIRSKAGTAGKASKLGGENVSVPSTAAVSEAPSVDLDDLLPRTDISSQVNNSPICDESHHLELIRILQLIMAAAPVATDVEKSIPAYIRFPCASCSC